MGILCSLDKVHWSRYGIVKIVYTLKCSSVYLIVCEKWKIGTFFFYIYGFYIVLTLIVLTPKEAFCRSLNNCYDFRMSVFEEFGFTFLTQSCFFEYVNLYQTFRCINLFWWRLTFNKIEVIMYTSFVYV